MESFARYPDVFWHNQRRDCIAALAEQQGIVLIPTGAIEQHGPHLPLSTDIAASTAIAAEAARRIEDFPVLVAPPVWWGLSPYHMVYPGTITLRLETLLELLADIAGSIAQHGVRGLVFVNGHGGNASLLEALSIRLATQGIHAAAVSYWNLIPQAMRAEAAVDGGNIGHAGEAETSLQLHLQRDYVDLAAIVPELGRPFALNGRGHNEGVLMAGAYTPPDIAGESIGGVLGTPSAGTAEKGARLFDAASAALAEFVRRYRARVIGRIDAAVAGVVPEREAGEGGQT
jgi:creatinine amidohydrolase